MSPLKKNNEEFLLGPESYNNFPPGPVYQNMKRRLFEEYVECGKQIEGIQSIIESLAISLHSKINLKYNYNRYNDGYSTLDGLLLAHGAKEGPSFLERLYEMPEEWDIIQLSYAYDPGSRYEARIDPINQKSPRALHLIRMACGQRAKKQAPYLITIPIESKYRKLVGELNLIMDNQSKYLHWKSLSSSEYFILKGKLDMRMKNVVQQLQNNWLGVWASLLIGYYAEEEEKVYSFVDNLLEKYASDKQSSLFKKAESRDIVCQIAKASAYLSEWDMYKGLNECLNLQSKIIKQISHEICKIRDVVKLCSARRHPVILILDEDLELFPWEMLPIIQDHAVCRMPSLYITHALFRAHKDKIRNGRLHVNAELGHYIVNPQQNLANTEKRLKLFLNYRAPNWSGTFGVTPSADDFRDALQNYNVFIYAGHGSGCQFLQGDDIQNLKVKAVSLLFGCSSTTSKDLGGRVEHYGIWHFYMIAGCPMVVGNLWAVTDAASDIITMYMLHNWLSATKQMKEEAGKAEKPQSAKPVPLKIADNEELCRPSFLTHKHEPDLLHAIQRTPLSLHHYLSSAALVFRGLPITLTGSVEKTS